MSDRFRDAFNGAIKRAEQRQWVYGLLGRKNSDNTYTFTVPGRRGFVYVTIRNANGAQTVIPARNDFGVEQKANLGVRMKLEYGVYVVLGRANRSDLVNTPETPEYGVSPHATTHVHGGSDEVGTATPAPNAIPKADAGGLLDGWVTSAQGQIDAATEQTILEDTNAVPLTDESVLKWISWANIKASLVATFLTFTNKIAIAATATTGAAFSVVRNLASADTDSPVVNVHQDNTGDDQATMQLTQDGTGAILVLNDGSTVVLRVDDGGVMNIAQVIKALTSAGIQLQDDAGNVMVALEDGGRNVIVGAATKVQPFSGYDAFGTLRNIFLRQESAASDNTKFVAFIWDNNQSGTSHNIGQFTVMNSAIPDGTSLEKRVAQILAQTDGSIRSGKWTFRTFLEGVTTDVLTLFASTYAQFASRVGIGVFPLGVFHTYSNGAGHLIVTKTGVNGTPQVLIPNGAGDVTALARINVILVSSSGFSEQWDLKLEHGGSTSEILGDGSSLWTIDLNANGELSTVRTSGSNTATMKFTIDWI